MILYDYTAKDPQSGEIVKAEVQADSEQAAAKLLIAQQLFPISISSKEEGGTLAKLHIGTGVPTKARVVFTRQLATLINAGLPLLQSLRTVRDQVSNTMLQGIIGSIVTSVEGGSSLSAAFAQHPKVFSRVYISLVEAGETSGSLDKALERIAAQQEKDAQIASKIRGAMIYPAIVLVVVLLVLGFMMSTILPQVISLYQQLNKPVPILTKLLEDGTNAATHFWWLALVLIGGLGYLGFKFIRTPKGVHLADSVKLHAPIFGTLFTKVYMARFARTLGSLLATGVPMLQGLEVTQEAIGNSLIAEAVGQAMTQVKGGKALSSAIEDKPVFLSLVPQMIKIGEQAGAIDQMLDRVAGYYEDEVDAAVAAISTTIEPVLMVVLGGLVAFVIGAILYPVYALVGSGVGGLN